MKVLLLKLSSMGDVIHTLPALSDVKCAMPEVKFTWVLEEAFAELPAMHPAVEQVVPVNLRKRNVSDALRTIKKLRSQNFDMVIDAQGLIKSALIARFCGTRNIVGMDFKSCREPLASLFYKSKYAVEKNMHAISRVRELFAHAFDYPIPKDGPRYDLQAKDRLFSMPYLLFLHGTTWESKHWPDKYWFELIDLVSAHGYQVKVTWATEEQKARARQFASYSKHVEMLPHMSIDQAATTIYNASGIVAVDTGFAHLAAAFDKPVIGIYGATDIARSGVRGRNVINLSSNFHCSPCLKRVCKFNGKSEVNPACMQELSPSVVWNSLRKVLTSA